MALKLKKQAKRLKELKKNQEKCKGIFIVRTLEPNKCNQTATQVSKEFLVQSDVLEFNRSRQLDQQHFELSEQQKRERKRKRKKEYIKQKKEKNSIIQQDCQFDFEVISQMTFRNQVVNCNPVQNYKLIQKQLYTPDHLGHGTMVLQSRFDSKIKECEHF